MAVILFGECSWLFIYLLGGFALIFSDYDKKETGSGVVPVS